MKGQLLSSTLKGPSFATGMDARTGRNRIPESASLVQNFEVQPDGLLVGIRGAAPVIPEYSEQFTQHLYANPLACWQGIIHGNEYILVQDSGDLKVWRGWSQSWETLWTGLETVRNVGPAQFVETPIGLVFLPRNTEGTYPLIFDGEDVQVLGFWEIPSAPKAMNPESRSTLNIEINASGYTVRWWELNQVWYSSTRDGSTVAAERCNSFGPCRLGFLETSPGADATSDGQLRAGEWFGKVQYVDKFGNLSAASQQSDAFTLEKKDALSKSEYARHQAMWVVSPGPDRTVGRQLSRTHDTLNDAAGGTYFQIIPRTGSLGLSSYATLPDNKTGWFPDNHSDASLVTPMEEVIPLPKARTIAHAFGRLWLGTSSGKVHYSKRGQLGTFLDNDFIVVDGEVTGLVETPFGLLVLTKTRASVILERVEAASFTVRQLVGVSGCIAPGSVQTLPQGVTVWLADSGFVAWAGERTMPIGDAVEPHWRTTSPGLRRTCCSAVHKTLQYYVAWLPTPGLKNNNTALGFMWSPEFGWQLRTDYVPTHVHAVRNKIMATGTDSEDNEGLHYLNTDANFTTSTYPELEYRYRTEWINLDKLKNTQATGVELFLYGDHASTVEVWSLRNLAVGSPPAKDQSRAARPPEDDENRSSWNSFTWNEQDRWEVRGQYAISASAHTNRARCYAIEVYSTKPYTFGGLVISETNGRPIR